MKEEPKKITNPLTKALKKNYLKNFVIRKSKSVVALVSKEDFLNFIKSKKDSVVSSRIKMGNVQII
jgi:hypothetical protein